MAIAMMAGMPTPPPSVEMEKSPDVKLNLWEKFRLSLRLPREQSPPGPDVPEEEQTATKSRFGTRRSRKVVPSLPRPGTFRRQNSERRPNLQPHEPCATERRTASRSRQRALSARPASPPPLVAAQPSVPERKDREDNLSPIRRNASRYPEQTADSESGLPQPLTNGLLFTTSHSPSPPPPPLLGPVMTDGERAPSEHSEDGEVDDELKEELDRKWILNLSMHFRDHSPREKFFLTYAETPQKWRRLTVSCDYRDAPEDSLEHDLQQLSFQRDKSARIYESIRMSLPDIQFYDTVTNLKLETLDDRLHVHVTEDVNEIIHYPPVHAVQHIRCPQFLENELHFEAHMSGFVYRVRVRENIWIKKEIPGPDSVDEFLYEINALTELAGSTNVIELKGLVVNTERTLVKGLLIGFAEQGALVDILYDHKGDLPWSRRARWAKQIVRGLSQIHEAGFVQGDFTLSNMVVDEHDEAKIIDINRRGCPVGWEPPEIQKLIDSGQRISMYIGVKSDLFQLGMVLWGIAEEEDEPERQQRPLSLTNAKEEVPSWYRVMTHRCLSENPRVRTTAKDLLAFFPADIEKPIRRPDGEESDSGGRERRQEAALLERFPHLDVTGLDGSRPASSNPDRRSPARSIELPFDDKGSYMVRHRHHHEAEEEQERGRAPPTNISHLNLNDHFHESRPGTEGNLENTSRVEEEEGVIGDGHQDGDVDPQIVTVSPGGDNRWEEVEVDGNPYLVSIDRSAERQLEEQQQIGAKASNLPATQENIKALQAEHIAPATAPGPPPPPLPAMSNVYAHHFQHVDSGLADMDQDLAGIGGNDSLGPSPTDSLPPLSSHALFGDDERRQKLGHEGLLLEIQKKETEQRNSAMPLMAKSGEDGLGLTTIEEAIATPLPEDLNPAVDG